MHTTNQLLDAVAAARGGATDYRLAKILETSTSNITAYRKGRSRLSLEFAHRVAALLEWDPAYVVACVEYERAQRVAAEGRDPLEETGEILATWERIAQHFKPKHVAGILLALLAAAGGLEVEPAQASTVAFADESGSPVYTLCATRMWVLYRSVPILPDRLDRLKDPAQVAAAEDPTTAHPLGLSRRVDPDRWR